MKKVISTNSQKDLQAFQEIVYLSKISHPHVLAILGFDRETRQSRFDTIYILTIVMPLMKETLSTYIKRQGKI
jgi:hypothetical protein